MSRRRGPELAFFAYARDLLRSKVWKSEYDSFGLHVLKLLEIDMANSLVPHIHVRLNFGALCKHGRFDLGRCEDKHATFTAAVSYDLIASFDEAPIIVLALSVLRASSRTFPNDHRSRNPWHGL